ncbi:hypothetical protein ILFOPFJJ_06903 [Ensifer psoraleae]|nr:hypothetical protein [Sinorhizobium psoraleae]
MIVVASRRPKYLLKRRPWSERLCRRAQKAWARFGAKLVRQIFDNCSRRLLVLPQEPSHLSRDAELNLRHPVILGRRTEITWYPRQSVYGLARGARRRLTPVARVTRAARHLSGNVGPVFYRFRLVAKGAGAAHTPCCLGAARCRRQFLDSFPMSDSSLASNGLRSLKVRTDGILLDQAGAWTIGQGRLASELTRGSVRRCGGL